MSRWRSFSLASLAAGSYCSTKSFSTQQHVSCEDKKPNGHAKARGFFDPDRVRGNYENRIKFGSNPEKVFDYFANARDPQTLTKYMTREDFINALLPFPFFAGDTKKEEEEEGGKEEEKGEQDHASVYRSKAIQQLYGEQFTSFFDVADSNKDNQFSYGEFLVFSTLVSSPPAHFHLAFKLFTSESIPPTGEVTLSRDEFVDMLTAMIKRSPRGKYHRSTKHTHVNMPDGRGVQCKTEGSELCREALDGHLSVLLFGADGSKRLRWSDFEFLLIALHEELLFDEFKRFGDVQGEGVDASLSSSEFARMCEDFVAPNRMEQMADRISHLEFKDERVTFGDLLAFDKCIRNIEKLRTAVTLAVGSQGLNREALIKVLQTITADKGRDFAPLVDVLFRVFDTDQSGYLEEHEFFGLLKHRLSFCEFDSTPLDDKVHILRECFNKHIRGKTTL
eukprot:GDKI01014222.1.p1 GENE.GDKI01014222.1~~GDKI01014222.1.p1  ORF type:complete len:449 (-),score=88.24 GDKI01014222.1:22-1368(-)